MVTSTGTAPTQSAALSPSSSQCGLPAPIPRRCADDESVEVDSPALGSPPAQARQQSSSEAPVPQLAPDATGVQLTSSRSVEAIGFAPQTGGAERPASASALLRSRWRAAADAHRPASSAFEFPDARRLSLAVPPPLPPPTEATFLAALQDLRQQPPSTCSLTDAQSPTTPRPSPITSRSRSARGAALATGAVRTWLEERDPASVTQTAADAELTVAHIAAERETERGTHNYTL